VRLLAPHLLRRSRLGDPFGTWWLRCVAQWGQVPSSLDILMILIAQQTKASVMSNQAAMSNAGICRYTKARKCTGVVSSMASQPTVGMLPRSASPIKIAPRKWPRTKRLVLTPRSCA
jgi:hypothetical protein